MSKGEKIGEKEEGEEIGRKRNERKKMGMEKK